MSKTPTDALATALIKSVGTTGWLRCTPPDPAAEWAMNAPAILAAFPEGWVFIDAERLAAVLICTHSVGDECGLSDERCLCCERDAAIIVQAAKEGRA